MKKWTKEETEFLINNYGKMSFSIMADRLKRTKNSVIGKADREGLETKQIKEKTYSMPKKFIASNVLKQRVPNRKLKSFAELKPNECQYGYGLQDVKFCGRKTIKGVYCKEHDKLCYQRKENDK